MLLKIYYVISILLMPLTGIYINRRIKLNKEDTKRFKERYGRASVQRTEGSLAWLHAASVGESLSILTIINELEKLKSIDQILLTTGTTSAAEIVANKLSSKTVHQYLPLDNPIFNKRFLYPIFVPVFIFSLGTNSNLFPVIPLISDLIYSDSITEVFIK